MHSKETIVRRMTFNLIYISICVCLSIVVKTNAFVAITCRSPTQYHKHISNLKSSLTSEDLIILAKDYLKNPSADKLAEDYVFRGPVVGPLVKKVP